MSGIGVGRLFYGVRERMTRRFAAIVIASQGLVVFFWALVAHGLAATRGESDPGGFLLIGGVVAVLCIVDAGLLRRPWGVTLGWLLQLATLAMALVVPAMVVVGLLFLALWLVALVQGRRMDALTAAFVERTGRDDASSHG